MLPGLRTPSREEDVTRPRIILSGLGSQLGGLQWESETILRIGRQPNLEIVLNYASVNRRHAEVVATPQGWMIRETSNLNGTFLNGAPVDQVGAKLQLQDVIQCGSLS